MLSSIQRPSELNRLLLHMAGIKARTALELGGGELGTTLYLWTAMGPECRIVSVDLPENMRGTPASKEAEAADRMGKSFKLVRGDTLSMETFKAVTDALGGKTVDVLLIDSEHTEQRAMGEFNLYKHLLSSIGIVAFHDICMDELWPMWNRIRGTYPPWKTAEFIDMPMQRGCGLGVILAGA